MSQATTQPPRLLLSVNETCYALGGLGRVKLYSLINAGELTRIKIGARTFVTSESIVAYVLRRTEAAATV